MTASDFIHVYGANKDADHPNGDLDRIDLTADIMTKRGDSDKRLWGIDPAFLLESAWERHDAIHNKDGVSKESFSRKIANGATASIYDRLKEMATTYSGEWWKVPIPIQGVSVVQSTQLRDIYKYHIFGSDDLSDYSALTENPRRLLKQTIKDFYIDFSKTWIFSSYRDRLYPFLTQNDYEYEFEGRTEPIRQSDNIVFSYYFNEQHLPHDPAIHKPLITDYSKAIVKSFAKPEFHNQYWDGVWSRVFGVFHVQSGITCGDPNCVYHNSNYIDKWVCDDGLGNIETLNQGSLPGIIANRIPDYLEEAGVEILQPGSTPMGVDQAHQHIQSILISYHTIQPLLRIRGANIFSTSN